MNNSHSYSFLLAVLCRSERIFSTDSHCCEELLWVCQNEKLPCATFIHEKKKACIYYIFKIGSGNWSENKEEWTSQQNTFYMLKLFLFFTLNLSACGVLLPLSMHREILKMCLLFQITSLFQDFIQPMKQSFTWSISLTLQQNWKFILSKFLCVWSIKWRVCLSRQKFKILAGVHLPCFHSISEIPLCSETVLQQKSSLWAAELKHRRVLCRGLLSAL